MRSLKSSSENTMGSQIDFVFYLNLDPRLAQKGIAWIFLSNLWFSTNETIVSINTF
jgi:hypothetical protein